MLNTDKDLKLYYSIAEVAQMFGVNQSLLRFWEKEFPQISPKTAGRGVRQYRKEDVETIGLICTPSAHLPHHVPIAVFYLRRYRRWFRCSVYAYSHSSVWKLLG